MGQKATKILHFAFLILPSFSPVVVENYAFFASIFRFAGCVHHAKPIFTQ